MTLFWDTAHSHRHLLCGHKYNCGDTDQSLRHLLCRHQYNCGDTDHSHRHLLCKHQYNCGDTDHSHRHLLCKCQYNCGGTDHLRRHLLCKRQYNCGDTDHSHRHLLCKHQYNCGATDHSHRHLLCKCQYNCGDTDQSLRHLLCRHQYNCGDTDHSHRHLLCKHQYYCGATDHSHRHLLCKHQYNCGATDHSRRHLLCKRQNNCGATDHSHRHLLCKCQYNCGATDQSLRHLLCRHQYNCGDTDHSHRHLLCKRQYNCGATDHSHRHLLCKCQYNCGGTDHSHRHLLCKCQYNCGATQSTCLCFRATPDPLATVESLTALTQTVANGCRTQPHPQTPKWNGNPRYAFGKNLIGIPPHPDEPACGSSLNPCIIEDLWRFFFRSPGTVCFKTMYRCEMLRWTWRWSLHPKKRWSCQKYPQKMFGSCFYMFFHIQKYPTVSALVRAQVTSNDTTVTPTSPAKAQYCCARTRNSAMTLSSTKSVTSLGVIQDGPENKLQKNVKHVNYKFWETCVFLGCQCQHLNHKIRLYKTNYVELRFGKTTSKPDMDTKREHFNSSVLAFFKWAVPSFPIGIPTFGSPCDKVQTILIQRFNMAHLKATGTLWPVAIHVYSLWTRCNEIFYQS